MPQNKTHFCKCAEVLEAVVQETGFEQVHNKKLQKNAPLTLPHLSICSHITA
jgi:hypothetical protein